MSDLQKKFEKASKDVSNANTDPGNDMKLRLYAHFKQSTEGDVVGGGQTRIHGLCRTRQIRCLG